MRTLGGRGHVRAPIIFCGVPTFYLRSMTNQLCEQFAAKGAHVPDIAIAGLPAVSLARQVTVINVSPPFGR